jgi:hypothetical protein
MSACGLAIPLDRVRHLGEVASTAAIHMIGFLVVTQDLYQI